MKNLKNLILLSAIVGGCCISSLNAQNAGSNIALNKVATASSSTTQETPNRAFDGDVSTNWCAPANTGWIQVDLQNKSLVDSIRLYVNQAIAGNTVHEIKVSEDMVNWTLVKTLSEYTYNNQIITEKFDPVLSNVRGVKINTTSSTSWVGWYEIEVYGSITVEINETSSKNVTIYPNPAKDNITVEGTTKGIIEIFNLQGQPIKYVNASEKETNIDISNLNAGVYSLKITTDDGIIVKKLLKQ